jgi:DNA-binding transcriptional ArsR family regulator
MVTERLRVIAEPTRIRLMWMIEQKGAATVQQLCDGILTTYGNVAKHLTVLHHAGLVRRTKYGNCVRYELVDWTALWLVDQIASAVADQLQAQQRYFASA